MTDSAPPMVAEALPLVKPCTKCGVEKLLVDFYPQQRGKFGRASRCKACCLDYMRARVRLPEVRKQRRAYMQDYCQRPGVRERLQDYDRGYYQRPEYKEWRRAYGQRPEYKEWRRAYVRDRRLNDPVYRLEENLRRRLREVLKGQSKSARTLELVGCDIDFLRRWLEAKFLPGMTWENYGEWHIDHIMPCASFDLSDPVQQRTCFRWTNLQPLWAADNIRKSDNYAS